jgi:aminomuconate-semialdehyde/2-hydroxymuconate-6-semialdehyde dehydrogenase
MKSAADGVKPVSFELGGKNAAIIFDDADFDAAIEGTLKSVFANCGQVCLCTERVYVHQSIYEKFLEKFKSEAEKITEKWPQKESPDFGPLISKEHREKVLKAFSTAISDGGILEVGGGIPIFDDKRDSGSWIDPTIFTGLDEKSDLIKNEVFGPVCHVTPFESENEVLKKVNDSKYGLAAAIWTKDINKAHLISAKLNVGVVWVNSWYLRDLRTPFGGMKLSGIGREGGQHSLDFYSELTNVCIKL